MKILSGNNCNSSIFIHFHSVLIGIGLASITHKRRTDFDSNQLLSNLLYQDSYENVRQCFQAEMNNFRDTMIQPNVLKLMCHNMDKGLTYLSDIF